jgi:hypothetical protein
MVCEYLRREPQVASAIRDAHAFVVLFAPLTPAPSRRRSSSKPYSRYRPGSFLTLWTGSHGYKPGTVLTRVAVAVSATTTE